MMRTLFSPRAVVVGALALALTAAVFAACEEAEVYVYTAQRYNPDAACLERYRPIEVVNGPGGDLCPAPSCLTVNGEIYVSRVCPPVPGNATLLRRDTPECRAALATDASCDPANTDGSAGDAGDPDDDDDDRPDAEAPPADAAADG